MDAMKEMSIRKRIILGATLVASLGIVATAESDLQRRPDELVHGNKLVWRLVSTNALGALAYLR